MITGVHPATPLGTVVTYACPFGYVFDDDWFREAKVRLVCEENGLFHEPETWPECTIRECFVSIEVKRNGTLILCFGSCDNPTFSHK